MHNVRTPCVRKVHAALVPCAERRIINMYIGIDLGGTNIAGAVVNAEGNILSQGSVPTRSERPTIDIVKDMAELSREITADSGLELSDIKAVGIGCPGTIDFDTGEVIYSNNIRMEHFPLADEFRKLIDLPVKVDNDANCAAMGEYLVNGGGAKSFMLITLGTGVGSGLVLNGEVYRGFNGAASEAGHLTLVSGGELCTCGKQGCWEAYASASALVRQTKTAMSAHPESLMHKIAEEFGAVNGQTAFLAAKEGDAAAHAVVDAYIRYVADGIVSVENIIQPEVIAIGGGISREGEGLLRPIREYVSNTGFNKFKKKSRIIAAGLLNDAGVIGAAAVAM